jgi:transcriptional regulator with XRE-family HTH domain
MTASVSEKRRRSVDPASRSALALGVLMRRLRRSHELTQKSVAEKAGIDQSYLSLIESGKRAAPRELLSRIARAMGLRLPGLEAIVDEVSRGNDRADSRRRTS